MLFMIKILSPLLAMALLFSAVSVPEAKADVKEARRSALKMFRQYFSSSFFLHPRYYSSTIAEGEEATIRIPVFKGNTYLIAAKGDTQHFDIDLYTYDEDGDRWAFDTRNLSYAAVTKYARWTGHIYVRVHAARGSGSICVVSGHR
jgi:hypothetical protein